MPDLATLYDYGKTRIPPHRTRTTNVLFDQRISIYRLSILKFFVLTEHRKQYSNIFENPKIFSHFLVDCVTDLVYKDPQIEAMPCGTEPRTPLNTAQPCCSF